MGALAFLDGRQGNVVLVGARDNPKGAVLVIPSEVAGEVETFPLDAGIRYLSEGAIVDVLCMQARAFGSSGLKPPAEATG
ncbi:MAG: hypothetical protein GWP08_11180 [Nitrospiraceae bacterium]|nr:hypothetical protein [Nitrospiraceae bacterium]